MFEPNRREAKCGCVPNTEENKVNVFNTGKRAQFNVRIKVSTLLSQPPAHLGNENAKQ